MVKILVPTMNYLLIKLLSQLPPHLQHALYVMKKENKKTDIDFKDTIVSFSICISIYFSLGHFTEMSC